MSKGKNIGGKWMKRALCLLMVLLAPMAWSAPEDYGFTIEDNVIVNYTGKSKTPVIDPSWGVTEIGSWSFSGAGVTSVVVPEGVLTIAASAFEGCKALKTISLPASLTEISYNAFRNCAALTTVDFAPSGGLYSVFFGAFSGCKKLKSIELPDSTQGIDASAFEGCTALTSFTVPSELQFIGVNVFYNSGLQELRMKEGAPAGHFAVIDGVLYQLYEGEPADLYLVPPAYAGVVMPPETVTFFYSDAFNGCKKVTQVIVPSQVTELYRETFGFMTGLKSLLFQGKMPTIIDDAEEPRNWPKGCVVTGYKENGWERKQFVRLQGGGGVALRQVLV